MSFEYFLYRLQQLKDDEENLRPSEYFRQLDSVIYTYCPVNKYYLGDYNATMRLCNNNDIETIRGILCE